MRDVHLQCSLLPYLLFAPKCLLDNYLSNKPKTIVL